MKKALICFLFICSFCSLSAQTAVKDSWINMPDSLLPYLQQEHRRQLVRNDSASVIGLLHEKSRLVRLTSDYLSVRLSESSTIEMKVFVASSGDTLLFVVKTFLSPLPESEVYVCTPAWKDLKRISLSEVLKVHSTTKTGEKMSGVWKNEGDETRVSPVMIQALLSPEQPVMELKVHGYQVLTDDKKIEPYESNGITIDLSELKDIPVGVIGQEMSSDAVSLLHQAYHNQDNECRLWCQAANFC